MTQADSPAPADLSAKALMARVWTQYLKPQRGLLAIALLGAVIVAITTSILAWWLVQ